MVITRYIFSFPFFSTYMDIIIHPTPEAKKRPSLLSRFLSVNIRKKKFAWYFRPVGTAAAFKSNCWIAFDNKNQLELSRRLSISLSSFEIQDKHIFNNNVVITVMLKEGIAFVLDPEWSNPITYEISYQPKLNWFMNKKWRC
jgi:hypothetical protein